MPEELTVILDFVEGRIGPKAFQNILYRDMERFEQFFAPDPYRSPNGQGLFFFLISQDYDDPDAVLYVQEALAQYLKRNDIPFQATSTYTNALIKDRELENLLEAVQPYWLSWPYYIDYIQEILPNWRNYTREELEHWLRRRLPELFRSVHEPPLWMQDPEWPIGPGGPYLFIGQLDSGESLGHGETFYVFYDVHTGDTETIKQVQC